MTDSILTTIEAFDGCGEIEVAAEYEIDESGVSILGVTLKDGDDVTDRLKQYELDDIRYAIARRVNWLNGDKRLRESAPMYRRAS